MPDLLLLAQIADLEARTAALERRPLRKIPHEYLTSLYLDSARNQEESEIMARAWVRQIMALDVKSLLLMAQQTYDPFPWQPLLVRMESLGAVYAEARVAVAHLRTIAEELLALQGLYPILRIEDIGEYIPLPTRALLSMRSQRELDESAKKKK